MHAYMWRVALTSRRRAVTSAQLPAMPMNVWGDTCNDGRTSRESIGLKAHHMHCMTVFPPSHTHTRTLTSNSRVTFRVRMR